MPHNSEINKKITKAASIVGSATFVSRILGYVRDAVIAAVFGAGTYADVFFLAYRIPNFLRRLVGEGSLTVSFIPVFTEELSKGSGERARQVSSRAFTFFSIVLGILSILGIVFAEPIVRLTAPGFAGIENKLPITISLTRWMFPFLFFICLVALGMGILNSLKHFTAPALSPALFNISMIGSALLLTKFFKEPVYALAFGVVFGGLLQFIYQLPYLKKYGFSPGIDFKFNDPAIKKIVFLMLPAAVSTSVYQINVLVTSRFASELMEGSISFLYYADRIIELPMGIFVIAVATAVLPTMSEHAVKKDWPAFKNSLSFAIRMVTFITIPAAAGTIILATPIVAMLFQRGRFGSSAAAGTVQALYYYSVGLAAFGGVRILVQAFYSLKDTVTPVIAACAALTANLIFCFILTGPMQHSGLALATSLASMVNLLILFFILRHRMGGIGGKKILLSTLKIAVASIPMGAVVYGLSLLADWSNGGVTISKVLILSSAIGSGIIVYMLAAYILKSSEMHFLTDLLQEKFGRKNGKTMRN